MGVNGAGKSTLLKLVAGAAQPDAGTVNVGGSVKLGYFAQHAMELLDADRTVFDSLWTHAFPQATIGSLRIARRLLRLLRRRRREDDAACSPAARRRASSWRRCSTIRRTSWCSTSRPTTSTWRPRRCSSRRSRNSRATMLFVSHDRRFLAALSNRVLELTPDGIHKYGGGYTEYVERTGHEAPGLRS